MFYKFLVLTLALFDSIVISHPHYQPPSFVNGTKKATVTLNKGFKIISEVNLPYLAPAHFKWKEEDHWKLIAYPLDTVSLSSSFATAPDYLGGNLFQSWEFETLKTGKAELIFKRYDEIATVIAIIADN